MGGKQESAILQDLLVFSRFTSNMTRSACKTEKAREKRSDTILFAFDARTALSQHPRDELQWAASIDGLSFTFNYTFDVPERRIEA